MSIASPLFETEVTLRPGQSKSVLWAGYVANAWASAPGGWTVAVGAAPDPRCVGTVLVVSRPAGGNDYGESGVVSIYDATTHNRAT